MIELPAAAPNGTAWNALCDIADGFLGEWTLIGARMVELYGLAHGRSAPRVSADLDALVDARAVHSRPRDLASFLEGQGFELEGVSPEGVGHRFRRGAVVVDVLAPDHLGARADLETTHGARTVEVPGGRRALQRSRWTDVRIAGRTSSLPCPDLGGALISKSRAVEVDDAPAAQRRDLAFLYSLIENPEVVAATLDWDEIAWLRRRSELEDPRHEAWRVLGEAGVDGHAAFVFVVAGGSRRAATL